MNKILLVKTSALGDIVQTFPVVSYLRYKLPNTQIHWITEAPCAALPEAHPDVDRVWHIDSKKWRRDLFKTTTWSQVNATRKALCNEGYDVVFDLQGNTKSAIITGMTPAETKVGFARSHVAEWPNVLFTNRKVAIDPGQNIRTDYLQLVKRYFEDETPFHDRSVRLHVDDEQKQAVAAIRNHRDLNGRQKVLVCPGSMWRNKRLPTPILSSLLRQIQHCFPFGYLFAWGNEEERRDAETLANEIAHSVVVPRLSLPALQNLMYEVNLVIAMDSLPLHLAGTTHTPTFSLFGPSLAEKYAPKGEQHLAIQGQCPYGRSFTKRCSILRTCPTGACLRDQATDMLVAKFADWWDKLAMVQR